MGLSRSRVPDERPIRQDLMESEFPKPDIGPMVRYFVCSKPFAILSHIPAKSPLQADALFPDILGIFCKEGPCNFCFIPRDRMLPKNRILKIDVQFFLQ